MLEEIHSHDLAKLLQRDTGIYLSNNAMKDAMLMAGFEPVDPVKIFWTYKISIDSPVFQKIENEIRERYRAKRND